MISDVLSKAVAELDYYLEKRPNMYEGALRERIVALRYEAEAIRVLLDTPPSD